MNILLTGAFGNVGTATLRELLLRGHTVTAFDLPTKDNRRAAQRLDGRVKVVWGDIRGSDSLQTAIAGQNVVVHLAAIIPPVSEMNPVRAEQVNLDGTRNVITAMEAVPSRPKLIQASSVALFGKSVEGSSPRTVADPVQPTDNYTQHKAEIERMVRNSALTWTILRLAAVMPAVSQDRSGGQTFKAMFDIPLRNPIEFVHVADVALAVANAVDTREVWGKTLLIGGGPACQLSYHDMIEAMLEAMGIGMLPPEAFGTEPFHTHWMDTNESQQLLRYQRHTLEDVTRDTAAALGFQRFVIRALRPLIRQWIIRQSPFLHQPTTKGDRTVAG